MNGSMTADGILAINPEEFEMPENDKLMKIAKALAVEDADTGMEVAGYGVYAVSSGGGYGIMF